MRNANVLDQKSLCLLPKKRSALVQLVPRLKIVAFIVLHAAHDWRSAIYAQKMDAVIATSGAVRKLLVVV